MDRFVHSENLAHYRRLLNEPDVANDPVRHNLLIRLLAIEEAKDGHAQQAVEAVERASVHLREKVHAL